MMIRICTVAVLAVVISPAAYAEGIEDDPCTAEYSSELSPRLQYAAIEKAAGSGCVLGNTDTTAVASVVKSRLIDKQEPTRADMIEVVGALASAWTPYRQTPEVECAAEELQKMESVTGECLIDWQVTDLNGLLFRITGGGPQPSQNDWRLENEGLGRRFTRLQGFLNAACIPSAGGGAESCRRGFSLVAKIYRDYAVARRVLEVHFRPAREVVAKFLAGRDAEWAAYFEKGQMQYPWELLANGYIYQAGLAPAERAGFPRPPRWQLVFAHPSVGIEYYEANGTKITGSLVVEVLGYRQWSWEETSQSQRNPWGVSAIVSFADAKDAGTIGYGAMVHTPFKGVSLGYIPRKAGGGHSDGVMFNVDIRQLFSRYSNSEILEAFGFE